MTQIDHSQRAHSLMSPSGFQRVMYCPGSVRLCAPLPEKPASPAALEGTDAHEWAQAALERSDFEMSTYVGMTRNGRVAETPLSKEMARHLDVYLGHIRNLLGDGKTTELYVERRLSLAKYFGNDDGDGTADCMVYDAARLHLDLLDLKYGVGNVIDPKGNPQALQYVLGAVEYFGAAKVRSVTVWIVQPRATGEKLKRWDVDLADLYDWKITVRETIAAARHPNAPLCPGTHCKWCRANPMHCPALTEQVQTIAREGFTAVARAPEDLGAKLDQLPALKAYITELEEFAVREARAGRMPSGRKWVETRGIRQWVLTDEGVAAWLKARGVEPYRHKLLSPAQAEDALSPVHAKALQGLVMQEAYPILVTNAHKGKAVDPRTYRNADAAKGFTKVDD